MKKNRFSRAAALLLAAMTVFSAGCAEQEHIQPEAGTAAVSAETSGTLPQAAPAIITTASTAVNTSAATVVTTTSTTAATQPALAPMAEPVMFMEHFEVPGTVWKILPGTGQTAALLSSQSNSAVVYLYDFAAQNIIREIKLKHSSDELIGVNSDGTLVVSSYAEGNKLYYYPQDAAEPETVSFDCGFFPQMYADPVKDCVYFVAENCRNIMKVDRNGTITKLPIDERLAQFNSFDIDMRQYRAISYSDDYTNGLAENVYSLDTNELLYNMPNIGMSYFPANDLAVNLENLTFYNGKPMELNVFSNTGTYLCTYNIPKKSGLEFDIAISAAGDYVPAGYTKSNVIQNFAFIDLKNGTMTDTGLDLKKNGINSLFHCYLKDSGRWLTAANTGSGKNSKTRLIMTDPAQLKNSITLDKEIKPTEQFAPAEPIQVGEDFRAVRNKADEIEKEFGIRILVGNEVKNAELCSTYNLISTEKNCSPETEIYNLECMREILAQYPKDFFSRFKLSDGSFGLRISLVEELENKESSAFSAAGVTYQSGGWYDIAYVSYYSSSPSILNHEMWHAVEDLSFRERNIPDEEWNKLNPTGFKYSCDFEKYATEASDNTYTTAGYSETDIDYNKPYFIDSYSLVTPMEDRATLIEKIFIYASDWYENIKPEDAIAEVCKYPHIKAKLDYLGEISKRTFGYVYWEEMLNKQH